MMLGPRFLIVYAMGGVAVWIGAGTEGFFANLRVQAQPQPALAAAASECCPGVRLPDARDMLPPWSPAASNYAVEGDFNGDGELDAAVLLVDATANTAPTLTVFHRQDGRYRVAYRQRLGTVDDVVIDRAQEIVVRLVKRGEEWAPEGGDVPQAYPHAFDAVAFATHKSTASGIEARQHLLYWDGRRYAQY